MGLLDITDPSAVLEAMREADSLGRDAFLAATGFGRGRFYVLRHDGREYDPKAIVGVAHGKQHPLQGNLPPLRFRGGVDGANEVLKRLGFVVSDRRPRTVDAEREWRERAWTDLTSDPSWPELAPATLRDMGVYGGQQGVWVDKSRTSLLAPDGIAVGVLHTGRHYADDLSDDGIVYHYPRTGRPTSRDAGEVASVKNCQQYGLPVFVISEAANGSRRLVRRAWVTDHDDPTAIFLMRFGERPSVVAEDEPKADFFIQSARRRSRREVERAERDPGFKFSIIRRYNSTCVLSGVSVPEMLDAAHIVPVQHRGSDDERNGLLLTAGLHRAYDAWLWSIDPDTLAVVGRPQGPTLQAMGIGYRDVLHLPRPPHPDALTWRHDQFNRRISGVV